VKLPEKEKKQEEAPIEPEKPPLPWYKRWWGSIRGFISRLFG